MQLETPKNKSKDTQKFTEYYRRKKVTGTYDKQREASVYRTKKRAVELRTFLDLIAKREGEKVLELGCSSGFLTKYLGKVTAIDTSTDMLEIAHSKNPESKCVPGDMFDIPFKDNTFDKVVTMRVWNHLDETDIRKAMKQAKRVLKKGGHLIFDMEEKSLARRIASVFYKILFNPTGYTIYQYTLPEMRKILKEEGFKIVDGKVYTHKVGRQIVLKTQVIK